MWKYRDFLPVRPEVNVLSMREGWTPLETARRYGPGRVYLKNEAFNPTGSHKDRALSIGITKALEFGKRTVMLYSDGSTALSSAAYAARGGLRNITVVPAHTPGYRLLPLVLYHSLVLEYQGPAAEGLSWVHAACRKMGIYETSNYRQANPYESEGAKTIGLEIFEQMPGVPEWVVVPVGGGGTLAAIWRAFEELHSWGLASGLPHMAAVLPEHYTMLEQALDRRLETERELRAAAPAELPATIQVKTAMAFSPDGLEAISAIRKSAGVILYASDQEVLAAQAKLGCEGIYAEPSAAAALVGVEKLLETHASRNDSIVAVITGSGFRETGAIAELVSAATVPISGDSGQLLLESILAGLRSDK
jgi:threonine synthase